MRLAPRVAVTVALLTISWSPTNWSMVEAADKPVALPAAKTEDSKSQTVVVTLDDRLAQLENRVANAQSEGRLTPEEAETFRSAIGAIAEEEAEQLAKSGSVGYYEDLKLQLSLDALLKSYAQRLHDRKLAILDLPSREGDLILNIAQAAAAGLLSQADAKELTAALKSLQNQEAQLVSDGLSYSDALVLSMQYDRVVDRIGHALHTRPLADIDLDAMAKDTGKTLSDAEAKLPADCAKDLHTQLDKIVADKDKLKNITDNTARGQATLALAANLQQMKSRIDMLAAGKKVAISATERERQIDQMISDSVVAGRMNPAEAHELRAELGGIIAEHKAMGATADSALTDEQTSRLALELERLSGRSMRVQHAPQKPWAGLIAFQSMLDQHIADAAKAGRITAEQAKQYKQEADDIAKKTEDMRISDGRFESSEALDSAMQMLNIAVKLHHEMKDRGVKAPDIDALQSRLDKLISESVESGHLTVDDHLTDRLNRITSLREQYEKAPGGLDERAKLAVAVEIEHLLSDVEAEIHHDYQQQLSLDVRLNLLTKEVSNAVAMGCMSVDRGAQYKAAVDTVYSELNTNRKKPTGLTASDSFAASNDIAVLQEQLRDELRENASMPVQLKPRYKELVTNIGRALASGRISVSEADQLLSEMDKRAAFHAQAAATQGGISHGEGLRIAYELEKLSAKLESMLRDEPIPVGNIARRAMRIDTALANALSTGKLTVKEAQGYEQDLEHVLAASAVFNNSDGGMNYAEALTICIELDRLGSTIDKNVHNDGAKDITARQADLHRQIKLALANGKLHQKDADTLNYDLERIAESEAAFRISDEGLNFAEALTLALDLDRVSARLESMSKGQLSLKQKH